MTKDEADAAIAAGQQLAEQLDTVTTWRELDDLVEQYHRIVGLPMVIPCAVTDRLTP